jgi:hypothetical protein
MLFRICKFWRGVWKLPAGIEVIDDDLNVKDDDNHDDNEERSGEVLLTYILERRGRICEFVTLRVTKPSLEFMSKIKIATNSA